MDSFVLVTNQLHMLLLLFCSGKISVMCSTCNFNEFEVATRNVSSGSSTECHPCPNCPTGQGLSHLCGSTISSLSSVQCLKCQKGIKYSDTHDYSMCQPCRHCHPNQEKTGECTAEVDKTACGKCQSGYYMEITGGKCEECSWCCKDTDENQRRMSECKQANLPVNRQCAKSSVSDSCAPKESNKQELPIGIIVSVCVIITVFLFIVFACYTARRKLERIWRRIRARNHYHPGTCVESESKANSSGHACPSPNGSGKMHKLPVAPVFQRGYSNRSYEDDENPSNSGSQLSWESYDVPNKNCKINLNLDGGPVVSNFTFEHLSAKCAKNEIKANPSGPECPSPNGSIKSHELSAAAIFQRGLSQTYDERDVQPVAPSAFPSPSSDSNMNKALEELKGKFPENKLKKKASDLPYSVLKDLCPVMNRIRESSYDDYRLMGEYMGFEKTFIEAAVSDPTKRLLELYGSKFGGTVGHVMAIFIVMKRDDAFSVLKIYCLEQGSS